MSDEKAETLAARVTTLEQKLAKLDAIIAAEITLHGETSDRIDRLETLNPYKA